MVVSSIIIAIILIIAGVVVFRSINSISKIIEDIKEKQATLEKAVEGQKELLSNVYNDCKDYKLIIDATISNMKMIESKSIKDFNKVTEDISSWEETLESKFESYFNMYNQKTCLPRFLVYLGSVKISLLTNL